jgi:hypothetical protein
MSRILEVAYILNPSGCKVIKACIELFKESEVKVYLYKPGGTGSYISMSTDEFSSIANQETIISSYFTKDALMQKGSTLIINSTLRVRFENSFKEKMIVIERLPLDISPTGSNTVSVFMMEKSWIKLVEMIPVLNYVIDQRIMWCAEVDKLVKEVATSVKRNYPVELEAVKNIKDFNKILQKTDMSSFFYDAAHPEFDVELCLLELFHTCQTMLLTACQVVEV